MCLLKRKQKLRSNSVFFKKAFSGEVARGNLPLLKEMFSRRAARWVKFGKFLLKI